MESIFKNLTEGISTLIWDSKDGESIRLVFKPQKHFKFNIFLRLSRVNRSSKFEILPYWHNFELYTKHKISES